MIKKAHMGRIVLAIFMFVVSIITIFPVLLMFSTSLKSQQEMLTNASSLLPKSWLFSNFIGTLQAADWGTYFKNSFIVTGVSVIASLFINSIAGFGFARLKFKGRDTMFVMSLIGMMIPPQVSMIPLFVIMKNFPLFGGNDILGQGGMGMLNTYTGLILPQVAGAYGVFLFRQYFMNFPSSLDDAAKIDGLTTFQRYTRIYVPLGKPIFATLAVMKATLVWNDYTWPLILTRTEKMRTVQLALSLFRGDEGTNWPFLMCATAMISLPLIIAFIFAQKYFIEGIASTGMK